VLLTSTHNSTIKFVRSLQRAAVRRESGFYLAEGVRLVREAVDSGQRCPTVLRDSESLARTPEGVQLSESLNGWAAEVHDVAPHVMKAVAGTETPPGVLAVLEFPRWGPLAEHSGNRFGVILDAVSDPGNAGTIARTGLAFGIDYLVTTPGSADLFSPKVVRAGMGAHFRLPMYQHVPWPNIGGTLTTTFVAASADGEMLLADLQWPDRFALVIGSEAHGLSPASHSWVRVRVRIPMQPAVESLNASVAAGVLMYAAAGSHVRGATERYK
jgi:TrmH family RNA methyltransferase